MRTGIPSFLITLGTFFILQGANLGVTKLVTGSVSSPNINQMDGYASLNCIFAHTFQIGSVQLNITVIWWILFVALSQYILHRTKIGNWIYAVGGNAASARAVGVPVTRVKVGLFMTVGFLGWFAGMHLLYNFNVLQAGNGVGNEFLYIIAAVVGGTLMTGGYGNAIGVAIGAFIFGMTQPVHRLRGLGSELVQGLPRRDAAARRDREPVHQEALHHPKGGLVHD